MGRITSLFSFRWYERRVLLDMAALRAGLCGLGPLAMYLWQAPVLGAAPAIALVPCNAALIALISADWIEHYGRLLILGYSYNPWVSSAGELEGAARLMSKAEEPTWRAQMFTPLWPDEPGSGRYPYIPTFWGRVRAIWTGAA